MRHKQNWLVLALVATAACGKPAQETPAARPEAPAVRVRSAEVTSAGGGEREVAASVVARERATLVSRVPGTVVELPLREGERFARGALLVRLDDAALRSALDAAEAGARAAEADRARLEGLLKRGAATPREAEEGSSRAAAARAGRDAARQALGYAVVSAPFGGVVAARRVDVGDGVNPGAPLLEIEGAGGYELKAEVDASLAPALRVGATLPVRVDGQARMLDARVRSVSPAGDPATHRFAVRADLPAVAGLQSGQFARLVLAAEAGEPRLTLPDAALVRRGGLTGVYVLAEGRARLRWIAPGESANGRTEARAGLAAGERVALEPAGLSDGVRVEEQR